MAERKRYCKKGFDGQVFHCSTCELATPNRSISSSNKTMEELFRKINYMKGDAARVAVEDCEGVAIKVER